MFPSTAWAYLCAPNRCQKSVTWAQYHKTVARWKEKKIGPQWMFYEYNYRSKVLKKIEKLWGVFGSILHFNIGSELLKKLIEIERKFLLAVGPPIVELFARKIAYIQWRNQLLPYMLILSFAKCNKVVTHSLREKSFCPLKKQLGDKSIRMMMCVPQKQGGEKYLHLGLHYIVANLQKCSLSNGTFD